MCAILITIYPCWFPTIPTNAFTIIKSFDNKISLFNSKILLLKGYWGRKLPIFLEIS